MKFVLVLLVVAIGVLLLTKRWREGRPAADRPKPRADKAGTTPVAMVECAHCGLHLPSTDAVLEGRHVYCSEAHRRLGVRPDAGH